MNTMFGDNRTEITTFMTFIKLLRKLFLLCVIYILFCSLRILPKSPPDHKIVVFNEITKTKFHLKIKLVVISKKSVLGS